MTTTFCTLVVDLPPTPLGLLPRRWAVQHFCTVCRSKVGTDGSSLTYRRTQPETTEGQHNRAFLDGQNDIVHDRRVGARGIGEVVACHWRNGGPITLASDIDTTPPRRRADAMATTRKTADTTSDETGEHGDGDGANSTAATTTHGPGDGEALLEVVEHDGSALKAQRRLLRFVNDAATSHQLRVAPHDRIAVNEDVAHSGHFHHAHPHEVLDSPTAESVIRARQAGHVVTGFVNLRDLSGVDGILERLPELIASFGPATYGQWDFLYDLAPGGVAFEIEHAALLRTSEVVFLADGTNTVLWDPSDETTPRLELLSGEETGLTTNLLCAGHSFLSDGRLLVVGGGGFGPGNPTSRQAWKFEPVSRTWQRTAGDMSALRWYPTCLTLGDESGPTGRSGRALVAGGHNDTGPVMELYSEATDSFEPLSVTGAVEKSFPQTYPGLSLLPGGEVFYTPTGFGNCSTGSVYPLSDRAAYFEFDGPSSGRWREVGPDMNRSKGMSALMLQPTFPYVRVVVVGGGDRSVSPTVQTINLSVLSPSWSSPSSIPDGRPRVNGSTVLLPDGTVFVSGGTQSGPHTSWIYDPSATVNPWREMDELNAPRHYHSCMLLLPNGKIMAAGGAAPGGCTASVENTIEVFSPPYLFNADGTSAPRPVIATIDGTTPAKDVAPTVEHGSSFVVETPDAADVARVVLARPMAPTHQTDTEQRVIECAFTKTGSEGITAVAPDGGHSQALAPRGYYMLFLVNGKGTPSHAAFVHVH